MGFLRLDFVKLTGHALDAKFGCADGSGIGTWRVGGRKTAEPPVCLGFIAQVHLSQVYFAQVWSSELVAESAIGESFSSYLQSILLSCAAAICHLPLRFNQGDDLIAALKALRHPKARTIQRSSSERALCRWRQTRSLALLGMTISEWPCPRKILSPLPPLAHNSYQIVSRHLYLDAIYIERRRFGFPRGQDSKNRAVAPTNFHRSVAFGFFEHGGKISARLRVGIGFHRTVTSSTCSSKSRPPALNPLAKVRIGPLWLTAHAIT